MKKSLLLAFMLSLCTWVWSANITIEQARQVAQKFMESKGLAGSLQQTQSPSTRKRSIRLGSADYYYVFNVGQNQGYVIVSGDDNAPSVLGYSTRGNFDVDKIPSNMAAWLQGYADQIEAMQKNDVQPVERRAVRKAHAAVSDLISTKWDQDAPYNMNLPEYSAGRKSATGCSSTAMAQVMKYHGYPSSCSGVAGFTTSSKGFTIAALPATTFDWGNMLDSYSSSATDAQKQAVATLLQYVSAALQADYDAESTVWDNMYVPALVDDFGYSNSAELMYKSDNIPDSEWDNLIYHEISTGRPVIYGGQSTDGNGGHAFVVHGYDGNGYYAVNWGWSGAFDGYFLLTDMSPGGTGIGGGSGHYNYMQSAVIGISPTAVEKYTIQEDKVLSTYGIYVGDPSQTMNQILNMTSTEYSGTRDSNGNIQLAYNFAWASFLAYQYTFSVGFAVMKDGAVVGEVTKMGDMNIYPNSWSSYYGKTSFGSGLENGYYQIKLFSKYGSEDWKPCQDPEDDYTLTMQVTGTTISIKKGTGQSTPEPTPEVTDADRESLTALFDTVKKSVNEKMTAANTVSEKLKTIEESLSKLNSDINAVNELASTVESKLSDDNLTAEQKESYTTQLNTLKAQLKDASDNLTKMLAEEASLKDNASTRNTKLSKLSDDITKAASDVASITTKDALDAAKALVADFDKEQGDISVNEDDSRIADLEAAIVSVSVASVNTDLMTLSSTIDAAIAEAKAAVDEEAKKLEADKTALKDDLNAVKKALTAKQDAVANIEKRIADAKTVISNAGDNQNTVEAKIDAIKKDLKNDMLTAEQIQEFEKQLAAAEEATDAFAAQLKALQESLDVAAKNNDAIKSNIDEGLKEVETQLTSVNDIKTTADLEAAQGKAAEAAKTAEDIDASEVENSLDEIENSLNDLSLSEIASALTTLSDAIEKAIAAGEEEAYQKQQEEKLKAAKESCDKVIAELSATIERQTGYYNDNLTTLSELKDKLAEIEGKIVTLSASADEIEKMIDDMKSARVRTRASEDDIQKCQDSYDALKRNIAQLEENAAVLREMIAKIEEQLAQVKIDIDETAVLRDKIVADAANATSVDELNTLATQASYSAEMLEDWGTDAANTIIRNLNKLLNNINIMVSDVNLVATEATQVKNLVANVTAIDGITVDEAEVAGRYDMQGHPVDSSHRGIQIIRLKNGTTHKIHFK